MNWEKNDKETRDIWKMMNEWVYEDLKKHMIYLEFLLIKIIMKVKLIF